MTAPGLSDLECEWARRAMVSDEGLVLDGQQDLPARVVVGQTVLGRARVRRRHLPRRRVHGVHGDATRGQDAHRFEALAWSERGPMTAAEPISIVLILSGGLDSTVLLHHLRAEGHEVQALSFNYGQRHSRELEHAQRICQITGTRHQTVDLRGLAPMFARSGLVDRSIPIPHGGYDQDNMRVTVVPNRNMIMLSVAVAWAITLRADAVAFAAHHGYHTLYPDCTPEFIEALANAVHRADEHKVDLIAPFVRWTKAEIVRRGAELAVPFALTWSCYEGGEMHCGRCGTCSERREAFALASVLDPTGYAVSG